MERADYVIVGAGSAGCVLANRLSEDPGTKVVLLEAGGPDRSPWIHLPVGYVRTMQSPAVNWLFDTEPDPFTCNRPIPVPRGKVLGGSSSINGMLYVRGQALDYDVWAQLGNRGWSYQEVLPYFMRSEHREGLREGDEAARWHGTAGPLNVADMPETDPLLDAVIDAAAHLGYPRNPDYNGATQEGWGYYQVTQKGGRRMSAARAFLDPVRRRPNLRVLTGAHATRILLEGRRATGVALRRDGKEEQIHASREVILAAGAIQSPQLLELSGIGDPERLQALGIQVVHPLPGVGENHQDHYLTRIAWRMQGVKTLNERLRGFGLVREALRYALTRRGALTLTAGIVFGFVRTRPELETPDVQFHVAHASFRDSKKRELDDFPGLSMAPCQLRPTSRGRVHIRSADPFAPPAIEANFLHEPVDRQTLVAGLRIARDVAGAPPLAALVAEEVYPGLAACRSDDELLDFARQTGSTVYHPVGTCKMGPDPMAVVDERLRVHGVGGLRVVDASIMPRLVSGNTNAPVIMIAEKGSDMIREDARRQSTPEAA